MIIYNFFKQNPLLTPATFAFIRENAIVIREEEKKQIKTLN